MWPLRPRIFSSSPFMVTLALLFVGHSGGCIPNVAFYLTAWYLTETLATPNDTATLLALKASLHFQVRSQAWHHCLPHFALLTLLVPKRRALVAELTLII